MRFGEMDVTVTMTGEEWFTMIAVLTHGKSALSSKGRDIYNTAQRKLVQQVTAVSDANPDKAA